MAIEITFCKRIRADRTGAGEGEPTDAHDAGADAPAAVQVARAIAARHPQVAALAPADLHTRQGDWHARWARDFQSYLRRQGTPDAVIGTAWPLRALVPA